MQQLEEEAELAVEGWAYCVQSIKSNDNNGMPSWVHIYVQKRDETRISHSERRKRDDVEQEGIDTRAKQSALKEFQEEGVLYGSGVADRG
ncbi:hypothetical protein TNCV_2472301 [Trichonephila clavipes]|nr:hypothetical protein TNCV_2472301 [Trichonephila clavipes]